jgi:hypothetical protein
MHQSSQRGKAVLKNRVRYVAVALAATLSGWALTGHAFTLGDLRGTAVIGRTLDVSVQVQTGPGEDAAASCMVAELFHADALQLAPSVSVSPASSGATVLVRIQSRAVVDEPVVTVVLRSTCGSSTSRRYVLLADFPAVGLPMVSATAGTPVFSPAGAADGSAGTGLVSSTALSVPAQGLSAVRAVTKSRATRAAAAARTNASSEGASPARSVAGRSPADARARKVPERATGRAILKLDPLDILSDRIDSLDSVMAFAPPEDALLHTRQIASLEGDVKTLKELAAKNDLRLADLRAKLQQANEERIPVIWLYGLLALLLLCLAALAWFWWHPRQTKEARESWWREPQELSPETVLIPPKPLVAPSVAAAPVLPDAPVVVPGVANLQAAQDLDLDIDLDSFTVTEGEPVSQKDNQDAPITGFGAIHNISVEPILDIRQQAEFFVSLGQTERALRILKKQISESTEPNPFVYLDLLALYHSLGLKADFREYRIAFNRHFNGVVPDFPAFNLEGNDLLAYPETLATLVQIWPSAQALVFLDACIFHNSQVQPQPSFHLAAFRDLLMLHTLAEEVGTELPWQSAPPPDARLVQPDPVTSLEPVAAATPHRKDLVVTQDVKSEITLVDSGTKPLPIPSKPVEESPSRMLDLDFSTLTADTVGQSGLSDVAKTVPDMLPDTVTLPYPARSRWPVPKKPD